MQRYEHLRKDLPALLRPTKVENVVLPSGREIALPYCAPSFMRWIGERPSFSFGNKVFLNHDGVPVFAEILILRSLEKEGWQGRWISSYGGRKFLCEMPTAAKLGPEVPLPEKHGQLISKIFARAGGPGGCFDVFAWRDGNIVFCEAKRQQRDRLRPTQKRWMDAALAEGVKEKDLLVVEWLPFDPIAWGRSRGLGALRK